VTSLPSFVDIHCHLLPGADDGAADWEEALAMARLAVADGISAVVATPHQGGLFPCDRGPSIREQVRAFQQSLDREQTPLRVFSGGELRIEDGLVPAEVIAGVANGQILTLADRRRHLLLDLAENEYLPVEPLLAALRPAGLTGILAHPERNRRILAQPELLDTLVRAGCALQLTADSMVGEFGSEVQRLAHRLVRDGVVQLVASDAHHAHFRRPLLADAFRCVAGLADEETARQLCIDNPNRILAGQPLIPIRQPLQSR
jgi:protein-tyrosine phosphatase